MPEHIWLYDHFNSSMVQLEAFLLRSVHIAFRYFNSSMVQLEVQIHVDCSHLRIFQFQYGAIRSYSFNHRLPYETNFNSSMVQLEVTNELCKSFGMYNFNSSMVQLEVTNPITCTFPYEISIPVWCN